jgi:hypothetical protein
MKLEEMSWIAGCIALPLMVVIWLIDRKQFTDFCKKWKGLILVAFIVVALMVALSHGCFNWLTHGVTLPIWALLVTVLLVVLIAFLGWLIGNTISTRPLPLMEQFQPSEQVQPKQPLLTPQPNPLLYVNDEIFGVRWSWDYIGRMINTPSLIAFCPRQNCRCRLEAKTDFNKYIPHVYALPISLNCPRCGFRQDFDYGMEKLKYNVGVEIERRINTGEYIKLLTGHE